VANFTAGTSFTDGVTNDVTAAKLNALVADAVPTANLSLNSTTGTIATLNSTTGTIATLNSTTGTIATLNSTTGTIATLNSTTGTIATLNSTTGTIATLNSTTPTFLGAITASTNTINVGSGQIFKDASGNVGIGTASPSSYGKLTVDDTAAQSVYIRSSTSNYSGLFLENTNSATKWQIGVEGGFFNTAGKLNIGIAAVGPAIMIDSNRNVGIGTASPSAQLELSTDSAKKPSTNTWTIASDQRLKTNITNADNDRCYEIVKQVPLKRYTWKSEVYSQEKVKDRSKLGWIAQDVEEVFPKAVGTSRFIYNQVFEDVVTLELDYDGNAVLDENGVAKTKTEKRLVSEDVIEDCKDLNSDQIYAAMYGTIQKLIEKVEFLESKVAVLEAA
jgi:hypothetical protein